MYGTYLNRYGTFLHGSRHPSSLTCFGSLTMFKGQTHIGSETDEKDQHTRFEHTLKIGAASHYTMHAYNPSKRAKLLQDHI